MFCFVQIASTVLETSLKYMEELVSALAYFYYVF